LRLRMRKLPVGREDGLLVEQVGDETVVYDDQSKEAHCLSPLAAVVFANCDGRTSVEKIARLATDRLGEPVDADQVYAALEQLDDRKLMAFMPPDGGVSRRDMIRRSAAVAGGAAMAPLIATVAAPNAIAANSATCANLLCCPCCTISKLNLQECCTITGVTVNCQCTNGSRTLEIPNLNAKCGQPAGPPNGCAKYCKPSGNSAPSDAQCAAMWNSQDAFTVCGQVPNFPTAGVCACNACAGCTT
jgi:hypothetical protein